MRFKKQFSRCSDDGPGPHGAGVLCWVARPWLVFGGVFVLGLGLMAISHWLYGDFAPDAASPAVRDASVQALRIQVRWLSVSMCFMVALAAAFVAHWVGVARRERVTRALADTLRDQAQSAQRAAESAQRAAEAASQDKAKFLGMLSHELLTPLQTILSTLGLIESRGGVDVSDPTFMRLKESTRILRSRMSDLVDFAKLSVGQLELRARAFTPLRLLTMLVDDHSEALLEKSLDLHWEPTPELSQRMYSDPTRIRQILENILSNAIKYTERGGISLQAEVTQGVFKVEIADSGTGIAPEHLPHVFDPFYRVKESAHMAVGSGLGLAVVRSLVDMLQGRIEVHSELGKGARFVVEIPVSLEPVTQLPRAPRLRPPSRLPVLVVDDDASVRHSMADVVRTLGYEAVEVSNGRTALQEAGGRPFCAIFCDVQLPDLSGIDVAEQIRNGSGPNAKTYLVRMSAFHEPDQRGEVLFNARVDKPVDLRQVEEVLSMAEQAGPR